MKGALRNEKKHTDSRACVRFILRFYVVEGNNYKNTKKLSVLESTKKKQDEENDIIDNVDLSIVAKYKMNLQGTVVDGEIYATDDTGIESIIDKIELITKEYNDKSIFRAYAAKSTSNNSLLVEKDWVLLNETKVDAVLDYKNTNYASFSEWRSTL